MKLALVSSAPDRWLPIVYEMPVDEVEHTIDEFINDKGEIDLEGKTIVYDPITQEEAQEKLLALLGQPMVMDGNGNLS